MWVKKLKTYPKDFQIYWFRARCHVRGFDAFDLDQKEQIIRIAYNCYRYGKKTMKKRMNYVFGDSI